MKRIAIVEDHLDMSEVLKLVLQGLHEIHTFSTPSQFLSRARLEKFDLVLLDLSLPQMDGHQVFQELRQIDNSVPVVAVTARSSPKDISAAFEAGFADYVVKPILDLNAFRDRITRQVA